MLLLLLLCFALTATPMWLRFACSCGIYGRFLARMLSRCGNLRGHYIGR